MGTEPKSTYAIDPEAGQEREGAAQHFEATHLSSATPGTGGNRGLLAWGTPILYAPVTHARGTRSEEKGPSRIPTGASGITRLSLVPRMPVLAAG